MSQRIESSGIQRVSPRRGKLNLARPFKGS